VQQRERFSFLSRHLDLTEIDDFLSGRVGDALVSEHRDSQSDEYDRDYGLWFHRTSHFLNFNGTKGLLYYPIPSKPEKSISTPRWSSGFLRFSCHLRH